FDELKGSAPFGRKLERHSIHAHFDGRRRSIEHVVLAFALPPELLHDSGLVVLVSDDLQQGRLRAIRTHFEPKAESRRRLALELSFRRGQEVVAARFMWLVPCGNVVKITVPSMAHTLPHQVLARGEPRGTSSGKSEVVLA